MANTSSLASRFCRRSSLWSSDSLDSLIDAGNGTVLQGFERKIICKFGDRIAMTGDQQLFFLRISHCLVWEQRTHAYRPRMVVILPRTLIAVFLMWWPGDEFSFGNGNEFPMKASDSWPFSADPPSKTIQNHFLGEVFGVHILTWQSGEDETNPFWWLKKTRCHNYYNPAHSYSFSVSRLQNRSKRTDFHKVPPFFLHFSPISSGDHSKWIGFGVYPLVNIQKTIENGQVEIVDLPISSMVDLSIVFCTFTRGYSYFIDGNIRESFFYPQSN